jgi:predicted  nucleic acid-binding Zn-ribbon protein
VNIPAQIEVLKSLAVLDAELAALEGELRVEQEALTGKQTLLAELEARVQSGSSSLQEMDKTRTSLLGEMRQMNAQIDKAREKLARCRNEREANAATRELEELRKLYRDREREIEKLVEVAEQARTDVDATSERRVQVAGELGQSEGQSSEKISSLESRRAEKNTARAELTKKLDQSLFRKYELVRKRKGSGVAPAAAGSCTACHISLPPMLFQQIMYSRALHQCPQCHRVLYFEVPKADGDPGTGEAGAGDANDSEASVNQAG